MEDKNNDFDIFGSQEADINAHSSPQKRESVIYAPKAKDTPDGLYEAKLRFLYNPKDPINGSIIKKIVYYLKDAEGRGNYFDSPQSVGDWDACPIGQLWKKLKNSESALDRKNAKELNRRTVFYSLVYIIEDKVKPENNGKIKVLKYGKKVKAKLDRYLEPSSGPKVDIFNFYNGYNFDMTITRQGNFNDYERAGFEVKPSAIPLEGFDPDGDNRELLQDLMKDAPDLEEYRYKKWDDQQRAKLESVLNQFRSPGEHVSNVAGDTGSSETPKAKKEAKAPTPDPVVENTSQDTSNQSEAKEATAEGDENLDSFLDDLGI